MHTTIILLCSVGWPLPDMNQEGQERERTGLAKPAPGAAEPATVSAEACLALYRPWVADKAGLSAKQKAEVDRIIADYHRELSRIHRDYPSGSQDKEGLTIRDKVIDEATRAESAVVKQLKAVLTDKQKTTLAALQEKDFGQFDLKVKPEHVTWPVPAGESKDPFHGLDLAPAQRDMMQTIDRGMGKELRDLREGKDRGDVLADRLVKVLNDTRQRKMDVLTKQQREQVEWRLPAGAMRVSLLHHFVPDALAQRLPGKKTSDGTVLQVKGSAAVLERKGQPLGVFLWHHEGERLISAHAFSPSGRIVVTAANRLPRSPSPGGRSGEGEMRVWEVKTGKLLGVIDYHESITNVSLASDDVILFASTPINGR